MHPLPNPQAPFRLQQSTGEPRRQTGDVQDLRPGGEDREEGEGG